MIRTVEFLDKRKKFTECLNNNAGKMSSPITREISQNFQVWEKQNQVLFLPQLVTVMC